MITSNVLTRVFRIRYADGYGTCFTLDIDNRQYLVTAKHVVAGISGGAVVEVFRHGAWHALGVEVVGEAPGEADVTVLAPAIQLSRTLPLPARVDGLALYQDMYFLGFPYNMYMDVGETNGFPMPFAKRALLSATVQGNDMMDLLYLDGHNNPGFSGGPVVWTERGKLVYSVGGVISAYRYENEPIYAGDEPTPLAYRYNTGIIVAYGIGHVTKLVANNPVGFQLPG